MLGQYRRRWSGMILPLDQCLVLAEIQSPPSPAADLDGGYWVKSVTVSLMFLKIILFYRIARCMSLYVIINDKVK